MALKSVQQNGQVHVKFGHFSVLLLSFSWDPCLSTSQIWKSNTSFLPHFRSYWISFRAFALIMVIFIFFLKEIMEKFGLSYTKNIQEVSRMLVTLVHY